MILWFFCAAAAFAPLAAEERTLYWKQIESDAFLDSQGNLEVTETHTVVFSGDFNGGERTFPFSLQAFFRPALVQVHGVERLEGGSWLPLNRGSLDTLHNYDYSAVNGILRWRARNPSDPEFKNTVLTYRIRFTWPYVLERDGESLRFNQDFGLPERSERIENFRVRLRLDPSWKTKSPVDESWIEAGKMGPGQGFVRTLSLDLPENVPYAYRTYSEKLLLKLSAFALLPLALLLAVLWIRRENETGLYANPGEINRAWIAEHILKLPPEVIADAAGGFEQILRTLVFKLKHNGLIAYSAGRFQRLGTGDGTDRQFLDALFRGQSETTLEEVAAYRKKANLSGIESEAWSAAYEWRNMRNLERYDTELPWYKEPWPYALLAFLVQGTLAALGRLPIADAAFLTVLYLLSFLAGRRPAVPPSAAASAAAALGYYGLALSVIFLPSLSEFGLFVNPLAGFIFFICVMRSRSIRPVQIRTRWQQLAERGHAWFERELKTNRDGVLKGELAPYVPALGLEEHIVRKTAAAPAADGPEREVRDPRDLAPDPLTAGPAKEREGGAFGGAGATGSWAEISQALSARAAASASNAAESTAGDSSSSSSSESSSSSSGGGGAGGW